MGATRPAERADATPLCQMCQTLPRGPYSLMRLANAYATAPRSA